MTPYLEVPTEAVAPARDLFATYVASLAAADLGIPVPAVRWFLRAKAPDGWGWETWTDERELMGHAHPDRPGEVWVVDGLSRRELADTIAHEVHHDAWYGRHGAGWYSPGEVRVMESSAEAFAAAFCKRWRLF